MALFMVSDHFGPDVNVTFNILLLFFSSGLDPLWALCNIAKIAESAEITLLSVCVLCVNWTDGFDVKRNKYFIVCGKKTMWKIDFKLT